MLTENDIVKHLCEYLKIKEYKIIQCLDTKTRGVDVVAENSKHILYVEAKGETSSKETTSRYGKSFNNNQINSHVSRAILASMRILNDKPGGNKTKVGIALPDTVEHHDLLNKISKPLKILGITVFWVSLNGVIEE